MSIASSRVPELDASVFGAAEHPFTVWRKSYTQDKILQGELSKGTKAESS